MAQLEITSVYSVGSNSGLTSSTDGPPKPSATPLTCSHCKKVLMKGQIAFQRKGSPYVLCSTTCLSTVSTAELPAQPSATTNTNTSTKQTCHYCLKTIAHPQVGVLAPVDNTSTMTKFCGNMCLSAFNYKRNSVTSILSTKTPIQPLVTQSVCSMCGRTCISEHEVILNGLVHKMCSEFCSVHLHIANNLLGANCVNCGKYCLNKPLTLTSEDIGTTFCIAECLKEAKQLSQASPAAEDPNASDTVKMSFSSSLVKVKDEPLDEEYDHTLTSATSMAGIKDEPDTKETPCNKGGEGKVDQTVSTSEKTDPTPVIASVISLASIPTGRPNDFTNAALQGRFSEVEMKILQHAGTQTDPVRDPADILPWLLKTYTNPTVQKKAVTCKVAQMVNNEAQTDDNFPKVIVLPVPVLVPVPVFIPVPMNMYSQYTPKPVGLPIPLPVPVFLPVTMDSADCIVETTQEIREKIPPDPSEAELLLMAEMSAEQEGRDEKEEEEKKRRLDEERARPEALDPDAQLTLLEDAVPLAGRAVKTSIATVDRPGIMAGPVKENRGRKRMGGPAVNPPKTKHCMVKRKAATVISMGAPAETAETRDEDETAETPTPTRTITDICHVIIMSTVAAVVEQKINKNVARLLKRHEASEKRQEASEKRQEASEKRQEATEKELARLLKQNDETEKELARLLKQNDETEKELARRDQACRCDCRNATPRLVEPSSPQPEAGVTAQAFNRQLFTPSRDEDGLCLRLSPSPSRTPMPAAPVAKPQRKAKRPALPDIQLESISAEDEQKAFDRAHNLQGNPRPDDYAASLFMLLIDFPTYQQWAKKVNWNGKRGKHALPLNLRKMLIERVRARYSVCNWHAVRDRINERLRAPRSEDPRNKFPYE